MFHVKHRYWRVQEWLEKSGPEIGTIISSCSEKMVGATGIEPVTPPV